MIGSPILPFLGAIPQRYGPENSAIAAGSAVCFNGTISIYSRAANRVGYVKVRAKIGDPEQTRTKELEFLVDTGASYMVVPPPIAEELGLKSVKKTRVTLADKRELEAGYAFAYVSLLGREAPVTVLVFDAPMPLLGTFTLQVLGLEVDPAKEELRPSRPFALGLMSSRFSELEVGEIEAKRGLTKLDSY